MRPRELTLEGFKSYRAPTTFDWRGRRLVGIVGPIGAGKTSLLDGISFALYGKTPNVERDTKTLIHQLCDQCHVELRFEVDGQTWRVQRALRRKGQAGHRLELLESDEPDAEVVERINGERDVNARVEQLLGMDFRAFCRSVLLAQNRFHEFLRATPGDRDKVLKGVFGYDRLDGAQRAAKLRLDAIGLELDAFGAERTRIDEARTQLDGARTEARSTRERLDRFEAVAPEIERLSKEREAAAGELEASRTRTDTLMGIAGSLPKEDELDATVTASATSDSGVADVRAALEAAVAERAGAEAALADVTARLGDRTRFRTFETLVHTHEGHVRDVTRLGAAATAAAEAAASTEAEAARLGAEVGTAGEAASAAARALDAAEAVVEAAREEVLRAQHADMARTLRGDLRPGEPCPVCAQPVHAVPRAAAAPKVATAERSLAKVVKAAETAGARRDAAGRALAAAEASAAAARAAITPATEAASSAADELARAEGELAATQSQLVEWLGEEGDVRSLFEAREAELTAAEEVLESAKGGVDRSKEDLERATELAAGAAEQLGRLANRLAGGWGRLGQDRDVPADPGAVRSAFAELGQAVLAAHAEVTAAAEAARARAVEAVEAVAALHADLDLAPEADFGDARTDAGVRHGTAAARVAELEATIERSGDLEARILAAESRRDIADRLARDLQPSRFLAFLLEEERAELASLGSDHLDQLTGGTYLFSEDDRFDIIDLNAAGQVRRSDSLSGGETFLASLALALALAQMVARSGGRLDAFLLDEGFGSLDPEHLDRAMDGIGRLVAGDERRLVILVSHVAEMREAIEDLVVLGKDDLTGDTIVRSGAAPA